MTVTNPDQYVERKTDPESRNNFGGTRDGEKDGPVKLRFFEHDSHESLVGR